MGHDVIAFKGSSEELNDMALKEITERIESGDLGDFDEFRRELSTKAVAAKMRRSSFDRYNKIIYMLCDAESTYGGFSGNNGEVWLDQEAIDHALARLDYMREHTIPALCDEELEGMKEKLMDSAHKEYDTDVEMHVHSVDKETGEMTELTGQERAEYLRNMLEHQGEWGQTHEDNLDTEYQFLTDIKTYFREEGARKVRVWFG
jgi:hypothetical protein